MTKLERLRDQTRQESRTEAARWLSWFWRVQEEEGRVSDVKVYLHPFFFMILPRTASLLDRQTGSFRALSPQPQPDVVNQFTWC